VAVSISQRLKRTFLRAENSMKSVHSLS